ncbi:minichromosome maintenance protein MCM [Methanobrevibacter sp.]|uniref:minichromosome maintenance protein MCM n=1 Tax=Methanobrevibacter sp. TaxID=66852 RepID=UPI0026E0FDDF|nr:minichromosome maintenance protein MCM [Methanobrevibacter sp.]MDO5860818.1 minichromosome maintenance protein MCM [Methanobrevibacter sp.]
MSINPRRMLKEFIKETYSEEIEKCRAMHRQSKVNIDYNKLNPYLLEKTGKDFFDLEMYRHIAIIEGEYNSNPFSKEYVSLKYVNVPETVELHNLDATNNREWISCKAMVKNITDIRVDLKLAVFECMKCMSQTVVEVSHNKNIAVPTECKSCNERTMKISKEMSEFRNFRIAKLEEPLEMRKGGVTREFKGYMQDYLASPYHNIKAGAVVDVCGEFCVEPYKKDELESYEFLIDIHNITPVDDAFEDYLLTPTDKEMIIELSKRPDIYEILVNTLAPEVYGYETVKEGLLLQLFEGARPKDDVFKTDIIDRWTSHILLIGDPGIGKSQLITAVNRRAPKVINISGTNTSQVGLTTSAVKDELAGGWTMEAGGVILADSGLLIIDEFDKLSPSAQKSLNEPMEQLSISSAKAGIVQTMSARTSILAAANPKYSRFSDSKPINEQLDIAESTLSRFDLIFALRDDISETKDRELARSLLTRKTRENKLERLSDECFKKYITYMKANCFPTLTAEVIDLLSEFYVDVRQQATQSHDGKAITARDLKSLERLTIARAKCEGRTLTTINDAEDAIRIYKESLYSLGLDLTTAGEIVGVKSDKEMEIIIDVERMIKAKVDFEGLPLSGESINSLKKECCLMCHGTSLDDEKVFREAMAKIERIF